VIWWPHAGRKPREKPGAGGKHPVLPRTRSVGPGGLPGQLFGPCLPADLRGPETRRLHRSDGGRGTSVAVAREMGHRDLRARSAFGLQHPGKRTEPHEGDLSRCAREEAFVDKLVIALKNQRHATAVYVYTRASGGEARDRPFGLRHRLVQVLAEAGDDHQGRTGVIRAGGWPAGRSGRKARVEQVPAAARILGH
jgi:hypothetical protein